MRHSHQATNNNGNNATDSILSKNTVQDHFEKLYKTTTEATKARNNARLRQAEADRENDDPYDMDKFDRIRVDEAPVREACPKKQCKTVNQQKRTNQNTLPSKTCENGKLAVARFLLFINRKIH